jgi:hypothetical protein
MYSDVRDKTTKNQQTATKINAGGVEKGNGTATSMEVLGAHDV